MHLDRTLNVRSYVLLKNGGSFALFTGSTSTEFSKKTFKTGSHVVLFTFKNYFVTVFSIFSNKRYPNKPKCLNFVLEIFQNTCSLFKYKSSCLFNLLYYPHLFLKKQKKIIIYYNLCNL